MKGFSGDGAYLRTLGPLLGGSRDGKVIAVGNCEPLWLVSHTGQMLQKSRPSPVEVGINIW